MIHSLAGFLSESLVELAGRYRNIFDLLSREYSMLRDNIKNLFVPCRDTKIIAKTGPELRVGNQSFKCVSTWLPVTVTVN